MLRWLAILLVCVLNTSAAHAQTEKLPVIVRSTAEGLVQSQVRTLYQDEAGMLWLGTRDGGVDRFDGLVYRHFTVQEGLPSNMIFAIAEHEGALWVGTRLGLAQLDARTGLFSELPPPSGYEDDQVMDLASAPERPMLVATWSGLLQVQAGTLTPVPGIPQEPITSAAWDGAGRPWIATRDQVYTGPDLGRLAPLPPPPDFPRLRQVVPDELGGAWVGTSAGLFHLKAGVYTAVALPRTEAPRIEHLFREVDGSLWIAVSTGLVRLRGGEADFFDTRHGLPRERILSILRDREGTLHLGSNGSGLISLPPVPFHAFGIDALEQYAPMRPVWEGPRRSGGRPTLWVPTLGQGLWRLRAGQARQWTVADGLPSDDVTSLLLDSQGQRWITTSAGVARMEGEEIRTLWPDLENTLAVVEVEGTLVFAHSHGLAIWDGRRLEQLGPEQGFPAEDVMDLAAADDGTVWASSASAGVIHWDLRGKKVLRHLTRDAGLPSNAVLTLIVAADGSIWMGSDRGLIQWKDGQVHVVPWSEGMKGGQTYFLWEDPTSGEIWAGTTRGVVVWNGEEMRVYTATHGLPDQETNSRAVAMDPEGRLWLGTSRGLAIFDRRRSGALPVPDTVVVEATASGRELPPGATVELSYQENALRFQFVSPTFINPQEVSYEVRLVGYDDTWQPLSERSVLFASLPSGRYQFEVRGCLERRCDPTPASFPAVMIKAPWYSTPAAMASYLLLGVLLAEGLSIWRNKRLKARAERLERIVAERTGELAHEKEKSEALLLNILPSSIVTELKSTGEAPPRRYAEVTILFTDLQGFTKAASNVTPEALVEQLNEIFAAFDEISRAHGLEKLKTIGDSYMAVAGLPMPRPTHALDAVKAGLAMQEYMKTRLEVPGRLPFGLRVGVHSGTVVAGVIGRWKLAYDVWGDAVNVASRMESGGSPGEVNVSRSTFELVEPWFRCEYRGAFAVKGKGELDMYFVREASPPAAPGKE